MKDSNKLDELFRSRLDDFEVEPPSYVWSRIQEKQQGRKRRKAFLFWRAAGVAASVLLAFLLGWQLHQSQKELIPVLADKPIQTESPSNAVEGGELNEAGQPDKINITDVQKEGQIQARTDSANRPINQSKSKQNNRNPGRQQGETVNPIFASENNASDSHKQFEQRSEENRKQNNDQFQLLRLLNIELDRRFDNEQLADVGSRQPKSFGLSVVEQSVVNENAKLMANNRIDQKAGVWQVGAMLTPGYNIDQSSQSMQYASNMAFPDHKEDVQLGGGLSVEYKTGKRWSIQSGVYYSKLDQSSSNQAYHSSDMLYSSPAPVDQNSIGGTEFFNTAVAVRSGELSMNTAAGVIAIENLPSNAKLSNGFETLAANDGILLTRTEFEQNFEYIEIPLILRYQLIDDTFDLQLLGGFNTSILVANNAYAIAQSGREHIGSTRDMNSFNYSTSIGFGLGYGLSKKISIRVEPQLKYFLGSLNSNSEVNFKTYTIGVSTGLSYQF